jgi:hypothetical protein
MIHPAACFLVDIYCNNPMTSIAYQVHFWSLASPLADALRLPLHRLHLPLFSM